MIDPARVASALISPRIASDFQTIFPDSTPDQIVSFLAQPALQFDEVDFHLSGFTTYNLPYLEFNTARNVFSFRKDLARQRQQP